MKSLSVVKILIGWNVAVFIISAVPPYALLAKPLALSWVGLQQGMVWQLVTHQFLHANLIHLLFNMLGLWFAGRTLESLMGSRRFLILYLTCGVVGGLVQVLLVPESFLIGASGAVFGVVCAYSALFPEAPIRALVFFVIPVNMKAKWLGRALVGISLFFVVTGWGGDIGHAAHLGGALTGYLFVWFQRRNRFHVVRG